MAFSTTNEPYKKWKLANANLVKSAMNISDLIRYKASTLHNCNDWLTQTTKTLKKSLGRFLFWISTA